MTFCVWGLYRSGKGTLCQKLKEEFPGWKHLSVGQLLRQEVAKDTDKVIHRKIRSQGSHVPTVKILNRSRKDRVVLGR